MLCISRKMSEFKICLTSLDERAFKTDVCVVTWNSGDLGWMTSGKPRIFWFCVWKAHAWSCVLRAGNRLGKGLYQRALSSNAVLLTHAQPQLLLLEALKNKFKWDIFPFQSQFGLLTHWLKRRRDPCFGVAWNMMTDSETASWSQRRKWPERGVLTSFSFHRNVSRLE